MNKFTSFFPILVILLMSLLVSGCQKKEPDPIIKETIEGDIQNLQLNISSGSVDFLSFDMVDDKDGRTYSIGMDKVGGSGSDFNSYAYIDSTNLILPETGIVTNQTSNSPGYIDVTPIQSKNNRIYIDYATGDYVDQTYKTKRITGRITNKTILAVGDNKTEAEKYKLEGGIQKYLGTNLLKTLSKGLASDIDSIQPGDQLSKFYINDIKLRN